MRHGVGTTTGLDQSRTVSEAAAEKEDLAEDPKPLGFQSHSTELAPPPTDALRGAALG